PIDAHASFPHYELIEGNYVAKVATPTTHGNAGYFMVYRNYAPGQYAPPAIWNGSNFLTGSLAAIQFPAGNIGMSVVGNVLGSTASVTAPASNGYDTGSSPIYSLGGPDDVSTTTLFRHGNFDYFTQTTIWDASKSNHTLIPSLYRSSKPAFFGSRAWPWVG